MLARVNFDIWGPILWNKSHEKMELKLTLLFQYQLSSSLNFCLREINRETHKVSIDYVANGRQCCSILTFTFQLEARLLPN